MMSRILKYFNSSSDLSASKLFNERTFYNSFAKDIANCTNEIIVESPFITMKRITILLPTFEKAIDRGVRVLINTRDPKEHDGYLRSQAEEAIKLLLDMDVQILFTGGHHRKIAIFDRKILREGSLNILSQNESCEVMRRIESKQLAKQMVGFIKIEKYLC